MPPCSMLGYASSTTRVADRARGDGLHARAAVARPDQPVNALPTGTEPGTGAVSRRRPARRPVRRARPHARGPAGARVKTEARPVRPRLALLRTQRGKPAVLSCLYVT